MKFLLPSRRMAKTVRGDHDSYRRSIFLIADQHRDSRGHRASSAIDSGQAVLEVADQMLLLQRAIWKMLRTPGAAARACTSAPPSLSLSSLTGAKPSCLARAATGAIASSSSLDEKDDAQCPPATARIGRQGGWRPGD